MSLRFLLLQRTSTNGLENIKIWWTWTQREMQTTSRCIKVDQLDQVKKYLTLFITMVPCSSSRCKNKTCKLLCTRILKTIKQETEIVYFDTCPEHTKVLHVHTFAQGTYTHRPLSPHTPKPNHSTSTLSQHSSTPSTSSPPCTFLNKLFTAIGTNFRVTSVEWDISGSKLISINDTTK